MEYIATEKALEIAKRWRHKPENIIEMMHDVQNEFNYLPKDILIQISKISKVPISKIYSIATFYNAYSLKPKGKNRICVCMGTPCHTLGATRIADSLERELKIKCGETTPDMKYSIEAVRCLSACGLAPVIKINDVLYGPMHASSVAKFVTKHSRK